MTAKAPATKVPPASPPACAQPEAAPRVRPKLSLHYGAKTAEERK
ncbi:MULTISPECIES: hypothetical protein [Sphingomonas]|jgi:hypothetical protein|nr:MULTISPECIES: hypothetical protein [Sphingomonas]MBB4047346.1 hypothetical protein [Sphingomonas zeae]MDK8185295.1 hypothetical protein [Sphingomonas zeae]MDK8214762.1 hypothetical protein [Sphingomonas sp. UMB7805-LC452B]